jgi:hypothetical protein
MSAISAITDSNAAYLLVDGLAYDNGEVINVCAEKSFPITGMRAAVAATGDVKTAYFFKVAIENEFSRFDDVVAAGSEFFVHAFKAFAHRFCGGNAVSNVALIGWSESENRPFAFGVDLVEGSGQWISSRASNSSIGVLQELPILAVPSPSLEEIKAAQYPLGIAGDHVRPEDKLLHLMEIQRRIPMDDGKIYVGGQAVLTTVNADGVTQRVLHRWEEDKVGEPIKPRPVDWEACRTSLRCLRPSCLRALLRRFRMRRSGEY